MRIKQITTASAKGIRSYMEDYAIQVTSEEGTLVAVFDGHGGHSAAEKAAEYFPVFFSAEMLLWKSMTASAFRAAIGHLASTLYPMPSGSTLSAVYIPAAENVVYTAVLGDSPVLIGNKSEVWFGPDHNVRSNEAEADAARARGGFITGGYLFASLSGQGLQMARALGDFELNKVLSREPELQVSLVGEDDFILVATDGLFDPGHKNFKASADAVVELIRNPSTTAQDLVNDALNRQTGDNVTCTLLRL